MFVQLSNITGGEEGSKQFVWIPYGKIQMIFKHSNITCLQIEGFTAPIPVAEDMEEVVDRVYQAELDLTQLKTSILMDEQLEIEIRPDDEEPDDDFYDRLFNPSDN